MIAPTGARPLAGGRALQDIQAPVRAALDRVPDEMWRRYDTVFREIGVREVVRVDLPQPVAPGAVTDLDMDFVARLPGAWADTGHAGTFDPSITALIVAPLRRRVPAARPPPDRALRWTSRSAG